MAGPARGGCLVFCRMLPESRSYDALVREFRWPKPAQFNIGVEVCDRWAERDPGKLALDRRRRRRPRAGRELRLAARDVEPSRQCACRERRQARRPCRDPAAAGARGRGHSHRGLQARRDCAAARRAVRHRRHCLSAAERRRQGGHHQHPRAGEACRNPAHAGRCPGGPDTGSLDRRACRRRARISGHAVARLVRIFAGADRGRRSGDDDLHLGHHRPAQGRAACASRADRPHAGDRTAARVLPAARRPLLDAGRLGLGRRPARLPAAEPLLRRAGGGASASTSSIRRRSSP